MDAVRTSRRNPVADINVERRTRSIWPWIIGLLVLAALAWFLLSMFSGDDGEIREEPVVVETSSVVVPAPQLWMA
jgi:hypothetical protein